MHKTKLFALLLLLGLVTYSIYNSRQSTRGQQINISVPSKTDSSPNNPANTQKDIKFASTISIPYLRTIEFEGSDLTIESELSPGSNYNRYIASYQSEGYKIYGLLTIPTGTAPEGGWPAIVFNHGYIPPTQYVTTEKYVAYVDALARNGFVVFKIDLRGHGESEGNPSGSYFSAGYTIDAINALRSLQKYAEVNPNRIGMWGHSMAGNIVFRAMLIEDDIKASVIWAGAVYSYEDFAKYRLNDASYVRRDPPTPTPSQDPYRDNSEEVRRLREKPEEINFGNQFWREVALTNNLEYLVRPVQLHHAINDTVVNVGYSRDLFEKVRNEPNKENLIDLYEYPGGGHNIESPYFETAIQRTVDFFKNNL